MFTFERSFTCLRRTLALAACVLGASALGGWLSGVALADAPTSAALASLYSFNPTDTASQNLIGYGPQEMVAGSNSSFYAVTQLGGPGDNGALVRFQTDGTGFSVLHAFNTGVGSDGGLLVGAAGTVYGTDPAGGTNSSGALYSVAPVSGQYTVFHTFTAMDSNGVNTDGSLPTGPLLQGADGSLYGEAQLGGSSGYGVVFKSNPDGSRFTVLHDFGSGTDGAYPAGGLIAGPGGFLYGTTEFGGTGNSGTVFRIAPDGTGYSLLYQFSSTDSQTVNTDGAIPTAALTLGDDNLLYGVTNVGGSSGSGVLFQLAADGTGFNALYAFSSPDSSNANPDGAFPMAALVKGPGGNFYGTTTSGGASGQGTLFLLTAGGVMFAPLYSFGGSDGTSPILTAGGGRTIYGTAANGGTTGQGNFFRADLHVPAAHVLWDNTDGRASIWNYSTDIGLVSQITYGPYPGWTASALADGPDALTRVLWANTDGRASLWSLNNLTGIFSQYTYGPYPNWAAKAISVGADNTTHVLWDNSDGRASLWDYSTLTGLLSQITYGPYPGWTASALADGPDALTRVLWANTDGRASLWSLDNLTGLFTQHTYGPYSGWAAKSLTVGVDNTTHILWGRSDGKLSCWDYSTGDGSFTENDFGPYPGWTALALADGSDALTRVLWTSTSGAASLWSLNNLTGIFSQYTYGPYPGWTAKAFSAGQ